jgi:hypothetical protein
MATFRCPPAGLSLSIRCTLANATVTGGSLLVFTGTTIAGIGSTLMNVTVNGDMDLSQQPNTRVTVIGGLVLNGTMSVGKADSSTYGLVYFVSGSPCLTTTATATSPPGSYVIRATLGSLMANNYDFTS